MTSLEIDAFYKILSQKKKKKKKSKICILQQYSKTVSKKASKRTSELWIFDPTSWCVRFSANRELGYMPICLQQAHYLLHQAQFSDGSVIFLLGILVYKNIQGKMKNKTNCNGKSIARVKAMVGEDERITIQEIAEALDISSGAHQTFWNTNYSKV